MRTLIHISLTTGLPFPHLVHGLTVRDDGDLNLGTLTGSPAYFPLLAGSLAIDAADAKYCPDTDQAGNSRPVGEACDIGAFELQSAQEDAVEPTATATETPSPTATSAALQAPDNLKASVGADGVTLNWDAPAEDEVSGYEILRRRPNQGESELQAINRIFGATTYTDSTATSADVYVYGVKALNNLGEISVLSNTVSIEVAADDLATETATATNTQLPTVTNTPAPTATEAPEATAIEKQVNSVADRCIGILFGRLLVPVNNFFPARLLLYNDDECSLSGGYEFSAPGDYGTAYSTTGPEAAAAICQAENADGFDYTVSPFAMHEDLYVCIRGEASATETQSTQPQQQAAEAPATPTNTPVPTATNTPVPTATNTPVPTATNTPVPTATNTPAPTPSGFCVLVGPGTYWLFPGNRFLSGLITVYSGSDCEELDITQASIGDDGYVYTAAGQATAMDLCASGHGDGSTYNVVVVPANTDVWQCALPPTNTPVPTQTDTPLPVATNTAVPTATNTSVPPTNTSVPPTNTPVQAANSRAVTNVQLRSNHPGELTVSWNAPSDPPRDYRVMYARIDEDFKTWSDASGTHSRPPPRSHLPVWTRASAIR